MTTEDKPLAEVITEFQKNWDEMKAVNESRLAAIEKGLPTEGYDGKIAELEGKMADFDKLNAKWTAAAADADKQKAALEEQIETLKTDHGTRIDELKAAINRPTLPDDDPEARSEEFKAYDAFLRKDKEDLSPEEMKILKGVKTLTLGDDSSLGYAAPKEVAREFIRELEEASPFRSVARVFRTSATSLEIPTRKGTSRARWVSEVGPRKEDDDALSLGNLLININELYARTFISQQTLDDAEFNVEQEIRRDYIEQFAAAENDAFMNGDGIKKPEGVLFNAEVESIKSGSATNITFEGLMNLIHSIKTGYSTRSYLLLNRATLGAIRLLKDGSGQYIFQQGMSGQAGVPSMIAGQRYIEMPNMPNVGANLTPILFGDFNRAYAVVDRLALITTRDPFTRQDKGQVLFSGRRRVGAQVMTPEAVKKMIISA